MEILPESLHRGGAKAGRRPLLTEILSRQRSAEVRRFLVLREALLAFSGIEERIVRANAAWVPAFLCGETEFGRVLFSGPGDPPRASSQKLVLSGHPEAFAALGRSSDLKPATQRRFRSAEWRRGRASVELPLAGEDSLAEGVAAAMMLRAQLAPVA